MTKESLYVPSKFEQQALLTTWNSLFWALMGVSSQPAEVRNIENIPDGPHLVAVNHRGIFELPVLENVYAQLGQEWIFFIAKSESFLRLSIGRFFRHAGMIPVNRENPQPSTIRTAVKYLKSGRTVGIMPEGTRGRKKELTQLKVFHTGVATIAKLASDIPILPVAVVGTEKILPTIEEMPPRQILEEIIKLRAAKNKPEISMAFGEPLTGDWGDRQQTTDELSRRMKQLINELETSPPEKS